MPERVLGFAVGFGDHQREIGLSEDRGAEDLVALGDALAGQRGKVVLDYVKQALEQGQGLGHGAMMVQGRSKVTSSRLLPSPPRSTRRKSASATSGVRTPGEVFMAMFTPWPGPVMKARGTPGTPPSSGATVTRKGWALRG